MGTQSELEPLEPRTAREMYLNDREGEVSDATLQSHGYRLDQFVEWCDEVGLENLNNLSGRDVQKYKMARKKDGLAPATLKSQLDTLRVFLRFCASIDGVTDGVPESVNSPSLSEEDARGTDILPAERMDSILGYLSKYEYATTRHALVRILWETGMRMGAARGLDLDDLHPRKEFLELHHRPDTDTPLKNGKRGERTIAITTRTVNILRDYIDENRPEKEDEHGREPLFSTKHGRVSDNSVRAWVYQISRPCAHGKECPHGRDPDDCEAVNGQSRMSASKCPDSVAPHAIRRGAITEWLRQDTPTRVVSDRMNVGQEVLAEHYDARSEREKMEQRRDYMPDV